MTSGGIVSGIGLAAGAGVTIGLVEGSGFLGGTFLSGIFFDIGGFLGGGAFWATALDVITKAERQVAAINHEERIIILTPAL